MKFLSAFVAFASATLALAAVLPIDAAAKATAAVLVHREPVQASAAIAATATAAIAATATAALEERRVLSPGSYVANARDVVSKVDEVVENVATAIVARDILKGDDILDIVKSDAAILGREPQPFEKFVPFVPPVVAVKVDEPIKAEGVVVARDVLHKIPKIDVLAKATAAVIA